MIERLKELKIIADPKNKWLNQVLGMINVYPKGATFATQNKGEEVVLILRQHMIMNLSWVLTTIGLSLLPIILYTIFRFYDHNYNADALLGGEFLNSINSGYFIAIYFFYLAFVVTNAFFQFIHWYLDPFSFTNQRFISIDFDILKGRSIADVPLVDIVDISEKVYGFFPTIIGYGSVEFKTITKNFIMMSSVPQTVWIRDSLSDLIRYIRNLKPIKGKKMENLDSIVVEGDENESLPLDETPVNSEEEVIKDEKPVNKEKMTDIIGGVLAESKKTNLTPIEKTMNKNNSLEP